MIRYFFSLIISLSILSLSAISLDALAAGPAAKRGQGGPVKFVRWRHPQGWFSADVPQGWQINGQIDPQGLDKGAFAIQGVAPDGRSMFSFAHNWLWFMEYQYGPYRPGTATLETLVIPGLPTHLPELGLRSVRVVYASRNTRFEVRNPQTGLPIVSDSGQVSVLARNARGEFLAGALHGETMYIPMGSTPGLWSLRIFSGGLAPATDARQAENLEIQRRVAESIQLSPEFTQAWSEAHARTIQAMRTYSAAMERAFRQSVQSSQRASRGQSPEDKWAEMMRGGHDVYDERTGERHWVSNDYPSWWKNDQGVVYGNATGQPPADNGNWHPLQRKP